MIRHTTENDLETLYEIYAYAREFMKQNGNPTQWGDNRPAKHLIENDIQLGQSYVWEEDGQILGVFALIIGNDPTYDVIEDGAWLNDEPYGTIHRIASNGKAPGFFSECLEFCKTKVDNIRIDTHADNTVMHHILQKNGFKRCGIIYVDNGTPRTAYQLVIR